MTQALPFPVRLSDMRDAEERFARATPAEQHALHEALTFYGLLQAAEQAAIERRFPQELEVEPTHADASPAQRVLWDKRARELVQAMLGFGVEVLARHMDLVGHVDPTAHVAALALTATGSIVELGLPDTSGTRSFTYRPSAAATREPFSGTVTFDGPITLGDPLRLAGRNTTTVIVLAAGHG